MDDVGRQEEGTLPPGVVRTESGLVIWDAWRPDEMAWMAYLAQAFVVVAFPLGWVFTLLFLDSTLAKTIGCLAPLVLSIAFVQWLSWRGVPVRFHRGRVTRAGVGRAAGTVVIEGQPGLPLRIGTAHGPVLSLGAHWTVAQAHAFVDALAACTPIEDRRERWLWEGWAKDPTFRAALQLDRELDANQRAFPALAVVPELPVAEEATLDTRVLRLPLRARGATASVRLCQAFLRAPGAKLRRERVRRTFVRFREQMGQRLAQVFVWDGERRVLLGQIHVDSHATAGRVKGLVRAIEDWAAVRAGEASDVPPHLRALVAR